MVDPQDDICVIGGESIAIEAALIAAEGSVIAVEYSRDDRSTLEDNVAHFDLHNIKIIDHVDDNTMAQCPVPSLVFLVASASTEQELECLLKLTARSDNPWRRVGLECVVAAKLCHGNLYGLYVSKAKDIFTLIIQFFTPCKTNFNFCPAI